MSCAAATSDDQATVRPYPHRDPHKVLGIQTQGANLYSHILIPTDGSRLSLKAARPGAELAAKLRARLTAVYIIPSFVPAFASDGLDFGSIVYSQEDYMQDMKAAAHSALAKVEAIARKASVEIAATTLVALSPWEGIIRTATKL